MQTAACWHSSGLLVTSSEGAQQNGRLPREPSDGYTDEHAITIGSAHDTVGEMELLDRHRGRRHRALDTEQYGRGLGPSHSVSSLGNLHSSGFRLLG
jgi:hypothetical protein